METQRHEDTKDTIREFLGYPALTAEVERIAREIIDSAYKVHTALGPGLLESVYEACMAHELAKRRIEFKTQISVPIIYDGLRLESGLRLDLLVADAIVVELKAVEQMYPVFEAQILTYLRLTGKRLGFLINFNVPKIKDGITRVII
jgi:GxxExxY protein